MYRTHNCGQLRLTDENKKVTLSGWVQRIRKFGGMTFIDLRDRYGVTQLIFNEETNKEISELVNRLGREYVIKVHGIVSERSNKNPNIPTGDIEILVDELNILTQSEIPPFTIENDTDGGEELRMKYRYLDLRRRVVQQNLELRHQMAMETRKYLSGQGFLEVETPMLIKSTPEGARDFVVPSRINSGEFYALPQSPQTFKQLLMVAGFDKYFQIVKCFRDEDLRADRQPEFTQIDCEMSFVEQDDLLKAFEGLTKHLFKSILNYDYQDEIPRIEYKEALEKYGNDKPDIRFEMQLYEITHLVKGKGFNVLDSAEYTGCIVAKNSAEYSRKEIDELVQFVQRPQIGAKGLIYVKCNNDGSFKSSVDKFYSESDLYNWASSCKAGKNDLILVLAGKKQETLKALSELRLEMAKRLNLIKQSIYKPLWVVDFPLLEWDEETKRFYAMHHPFTSPKTEDIHLFDTDPGKIRANAYDLVINGIEIGGGSIRIHNRELQEKMFKVLGFTKEEAEDQFGFLMNAFKYGAPPHGGIAFGFDRWVSLFARLDSIRDVIAFPKNNAGRDIMINTPSKISNDQLKELGLEITKK
ncbi:aspartate--tRNA ligase [Bacteroidota bacterium]